MKRNVLFVILFTIVVVSFFSFIIYIKTNDYSENIEYNWNISISNKYTEIYSIDDGVSFLSDGSRYHVFEYNTQDDIKPSFSWEHEKNIEIEQHVSTIVKYLNVPGEYSPDFESDYLYYTKTDDDTSKVYMLLDPITNRLYVIEDIF